MGEPAAKLVPACQMTKFYGKEAGLNGVKPAVITFYIVVILFRLSVITNHFHARRHGFVVGGDGSGFAACSEVFPRIEAKSGGQTYRTRFLPNPVLARIVKSAMGLAGVFNHPQPVL